MQQSDGHTCTAAGLEGGAADNCNYSVQPVRLGSCTAVRTPAGTARHMLADMDGAGPAPVQQAFGRTAVLCAGGRQLAGPAMGPVPGAAVLPEHTQGSCTAAPAVAPQVGAVLLAAVHVPELPLHLAQAAHPGTAAAIHSDSTAVVVVGILLAGIEPADMVPAGTAGCALPGPHMQLAAEEHTAVQVQLHASLAVVLAAAGTVAAVELGQMLGQWVQQHSPLFAVQLQLLHAGAPGRQSVREWLWLWSSIGHSIAQ